jgi:polar amino acid transport system ATP-binding protein
MIKINNARKSFKQGIILESVTLTIQKGSVIGLAGPSGSGKTTLLRCIQKLDSLDSGSIECAGKTCFVFQDFQLFPHMTVLRNLMYASVLKRNNDVQGIEKEALSLLQTLGIESKGAAFPKSLSGGQRQRAALARSLMIHPDALLCDEPTSGLDIGVTQDVVSLLKSLNQTGLTLVIASHDLDFLTQISDKIALLKHGRIVVEIKTKDVSDPINFLKKYYDDNKK